MRLILAHAGDMAARRLADRWGGGASLLTPARLHTRSWTLRLAADGAPRATVALPGNGTRPRIDSVVCRLGAIGAGELGHVRHEDRGYAAAELTAFLLAWLTSCPCPVLNPPGAGSLNGPGWQAEQWLQAAAQAGLAVRDAHRYVTPDGPPAGPGPTGSAPGVEVTVVADRCLGPVSTANLRRLQELSRASRTPLLRAAFDRAGPGAAITEISAWPDIGAPEVATALEGVLAA
jgi:hypothetical protein